MPDAPESESEKTERTLLMAAAGAAAGGVGVYCVATLLWAPEPPHMYAVATMYGAGSLAVALLLRQRRRQAASNVFVLVNFLSAAVFLVTEGPQTGHVGVFFVAVLLAGLLIRPAAAAAAGIAAALLIAGTNLATAEGWVAPAAASAAEGLWLKQVAQVVTAGILTAVATAGLHRALEALRGSQREVLDLVEHSPDGIVAVDDDGVIQSINPAGRAILGDVRGRKAADLGLEPVPDDVVAGHVEVNGPSGARTVAVRSRRGTLGVQYTLRDVTDELAAAERTRAIDARVQQTQKLEALGRLAGGVAHDFNNLLTVILGNAAMLETLDPESDDPGEYLVPIQQAADAAARVTQQLLAFGRPNPGDASVVDLAEAVGSMSELLRRTLGEAIQLVVSVDGPTNIRAVPAEIQQVVVNLAVNAAQAMPDGGTVSITASHLPDDRVQLVVGDTGQGIAPELLDSIFEPYFTTRTDRGGTGIGLAIVHRVVTGSGGIIDVTSTAGEGTTFRATWPRAEAAAPSPEPLPGAAAGNGETVLFVDDDPEVRRVAQRMLAAAGFRTLVASGINGTRNILEDGPEIHILVTDVVLAPGEDGVQVAELVRGVFPSIPVLYTSGYTAGVLKRKGVQVDRVLPKPFTPNKLNSAVQQALARVDVTNA